MFFELKLVRNVLRFPSPNKLYISFILLTLISVEVLANEPLKALKWQEQSKEIEVTSIDKEATAVYSFANESSEPVEILTVRTSCGCTTANAAKKTYAPGESGTIEARFTFGGRRGEQEKTLVVETSEKDSRPYILTFRVNIPDAIRLNPEKLKWTVGSPLESQVVEIESNEPSAIKISAVKTIGNAFSARLEELQSLGRYRVTVTPATTEKPLKSTLRLMVSESGKSRAIYLPVMVE